MFESRWYLAKLDDFKQRAKIEDRVQGERCQPRAAANLGETKNDTSKKNDHHVRQIVLLMNTRPAQLEPIALSESPCSKNPRKKTSSNNGAAISKATHNAHIGLALEYAARINSGTTGRPRAIVKVSTASR